MFSSSKVEANSCAFTQSSNNPAGIDKILGIAEKVELNFTAEEHPLNVLAGIVGLRYGRKTCIWDIRYSIVIYTN